MSTASCKICGWQGDGYALEEHQRTHRNTRDALKLARAAPPPPATVATYKADRRPRYQRR